jgi:hypothetical protein
VRSSSIRAVGASARTSWGQVVLRAAGLFIVTIWLFYFLGFDDKSPVYTESDRKLLLVALGWVAVGGLLLLLRQRTWGLAWLVGSIACIGGYVVLALGVVFSLGS